jgi:hypothetical protein
MNIAGNIFEITYFGTKVQRNIRYQQITSSKFTRNQGDENDIVGRTATCHHMLYYDTQTVVTALLSDK